jgi:hypothetical protein
MARFPTKCPNLRQEFFTYKSIIYALICSSALQLSDLLKNILLGATIASAVFFDKNAAEE